jgi:NitT/TauT family transport system permease protein
MKVDPLLGERPKAAVAGGRRRRMSDSRARRDRLVRWTAPLVLLVAILCGWEFGIRPAGVAPYLVPTPVDVAKNLWHGFKDGTYVTQSWATLEEILLGAGIGAVAGVVLGVLIASSRILDVAITPYAVALNALPKVAIAPFLVLTVGQGLTSKIIITASIAFFPVVINVAGGLKSVEPDQVMLMRSLNASRWQIFTKVQVPNALPQAFDGLAIAVTLAPIGAVVGEFVGATKGIGFYITLTTQLVQPAGTFAMFVILIVMSLALYGVVRLVANRLIFWRRNALDSDTSSRQMGDR